MSVLESAIHKPRRSSRTRNYSLEERRRIVEESFREGAAIGKIARAHGLHPTTVSLWRTLYRRGTLNEYAQHKVRAQSPSSTTFLPIQLAQAKIAHAAPSNVATNSLATSSDRTIFHLTLPSGAMLRIETSTLDVASIGILLAEIRA